MKKPRTVAALEDLGRVRLSRTFFFRNFLYSEVGNLYGVPNLPDDPELAIAVGRRLCTELLQPLFDSFGALEIRSGYRSRRVNALCHRRKHNCASNERNYARHIWDAHDQDGCAGALACVVLPWFADRYAKTRDVTPLAWWIHDHLPYSEVQFFPRLAAFNIGWRDIPKRRIESFIGKHRVLTRPGLANHEGRHGAYYRGLPRLERCG
ncbi:MAG TPA: hypothetical protein VJN41_00075 [Alphaproteobacteria bacterium]|nr:hypothetical protein [Alphaproteobacteria bacterium]